MLLLLNCRYNYSYENVFLLFRNLIQQKCGWTKMDGKSKHTKTLFYSFFSFMSNSIEMSNIDDIKLDIKEDKWDTSNDILKNGFHEYHEALKKIAPELPAIDLIMSDFNYFVDVQANEKHNEPVNLIQTVANIGKLITCQSKHQKKIILNNLNLAFPAGSTTIVLKIL